MYDNGDGVGKDMQQAVTWFRKAAEQGHAQARHSLALKYTNGDAIERDMQNKHHRPAVAWFKKAAEQGHSQAQYLLGGMYVNGDGVDRDLNQAAKLFQKAARQGMVEARAQLMKVYEEMKRGM
jgi:TPR repeat protein